MKLFQMTFCFLFSEEWYCQIFWKHEHNFKTWSECMMHQSDLKPNTIRLKTLTIKSFQSPTYPMWLWEHKGRWNDKHHPEKSKHQNQSTRHHKIQKMGTKLLQVLLWIKCKSSKKNGNIDTYSMYVATAEWKEIRCTLWGIL